MTNDTPLTPVKAPRTLSILSLIFGISSLVLAGLGIITSIVALILARKAQQVEPTARPLWAAGRVTAIIGLVWQVLVTAVAIVLFIFITGATPNSNKAAAYDAQVAEQKTFNKGDTMHIGPTDLVITKVTRNYTPTAAEKTDTPADSISNEVPQYEFEARNNPLPIRTDRGELTSANEEYVVVEGTTISNGKGSVVYHEGSLVLLNYYPAASTTGAEGLWAPDPNTTKSLSPKNFRAVFRIEKGSEQLTLSYVVTIYRGVSAVFGTEGAKREQLAYTIQL